MRSGMAFARADPHRAEDDPAAVDRGGLPGGRARALQDFPPLYVVLFLLSCFWVQQMREGWVGKSLKSKHFGLGLKNLTGMAKDALEGDVKATYSSLAVAVARHSSSRGLDRKRRSL